MSSLSIDEIKVCVICNIGKPRFYNFFESKKCNKCKKKFLREKARIRRNYRASNPYLRLADLLKKIIKIKDKQGLENKRAKQRAAYQKRKSLGLIKKQYRYEDFRGKQTFDDAKCIKCPNKCIYVIAYCRPYVTLCIDHAPRMSDGSPGYNKLHIITEDPRRK